MKRSKALQRLVAALALPLAAAAWGSALSGLALATGCAGAPKAAEAPGASPPPPVVVPRTVVTPDQAASIPELFERAKQASRASESESAALQFDRVVALDPDGDLADDALFEAAAAYDQAAQFEQAALRYEQVARRFPRSALALLALVRAARLFSHLERWDRSGDLAAELLRYEARLGPFELVVAYGASALARLAANDEAAASAFIEKGRAVIDAHQLDAAGRISRDLAALYYALGELRRRRADRITFQPTPPDFAEALERRCQLLLDAQSAYSDTMRAYDAHWSAMAGYRVGELYHRLHQDVMHINPPAQADTQEKRQLFEGAMRLRYSILLKKALAMVEHTLGMSERTGERSAWVERLTRAKADIEAARQREQAALDALPFSRQTLERALEDLGRRAEQQKGSPTPKRAP